MSQLKRGLQDNIKEYQTLSLSDPFLSSIMVEIPVIGVEIPVIGVEEWINDNTRYFGVRSKKISR